MSAINTIKLLKQQCDEVAKLHSVAADNVRDSIEAHIKVNGREGLLALILAGLLWPYHERTYIYATCDFLPTGEEFERGLHGYWEWLTSNGIKAENGVAYHNGTVLQRDF